VSSVDWLWYGAILLVWAVGLRKLLRSGRPR